MPRITVEPLVLDGVDGAVDVWLRARHARHITPSPARRERVAHKIATAATADDQLSLVAYYGEHLAGMALAEPYAGPEATTPTGHVSMVFVVPEYWGCRIGSALLSRLQGAPSWQALSLWTRTENRRALRLYAAAGFADTGERSVLGKGEEILRLSWPAG